MTTYLVSATGRSNFKMWLNTSVTRINRVGGHAVSIDVEAYDNGGYQGTVNLTATTGRVVLSAGTFGSAKLLLRSGRPVFMQERPWHEWYFPALEPMRHFIPVRRDLAGRSAKGVPNEPHAKR